MNDALITGNWDKSNYVQSVPAGTSKPCVAYSHDRPDFLKEFENGMLDGWKSGTVI